MSSEDPYFGAAWTDLDEQRSSPVAHRYVHGGFEGTDTRFSIYLPDAETYQGRALQWLEGGAGGHEGTEAHTTDVLAYYLALAWRLGAYLVESNQGHLGSDPGPDDPTIVTYRANAEVARFARSLACDVYGGPPHHSYLFGGSGGGIRTILCLENVADVWDGGVPFVAGDPEAMLESGLPLAAAVALRLGPKLSAVVDAFEPGGSADPYATLSTDEASALRALLEGGFSGEALFQYARPSIEKLIVPGMLESFMAANRDTVEALTDQSTVYAGSIVEILTDDEITRAGIDAHDPTAAVAGVAPGLAPPRTAIRLRPAPPPNTEFATVTIDGSTWTSLGTFDEVVLVRNLGSLTGGIEVGGTVTIDTALPDAFATSPTTRASMAPFRLLPMSGEFAGKMILVAATHDASVTPAAAVAYQNKVRNIGRDKDWRLWWVERSGHVGAFGPPGPRPVLTTRLVPYTGVVDQALFDLVSWVEEHIEPPESTAFDVEAGQLVLPGSASDRKGVQPLIRARVNGGSTATVEVGAVLTFEASVDVPAGGGELEGVAWDLDGSGEFPIRGSRCAHVFETPGLYFPAARVTTRRADTDGAIGALMNISRVRVLVT